MTDPCTWSRQQETVGVIVGAFKDACTEAGLAPHPDGKCPSADCPCEKLADSIEARAVELTAQRLGVPLPELLEVLDD